MSSQSKNHPQQKQASDADHQQDVGAVVAKAKRAAASLWMIIHAQGCRLGPDRCPHRGCADTKKLLLHIKTCAVGPGFACPVKGCDSAKKLLAHYRRCRDIRARQAAAGQGATGIGSRRGLKQAGQQQHVCLVCNLMARHAKTLLDANSNNKKAQQLGVVLSKSERWRARKDARQQQQHTEQRDMSADSMQQMRPCKSFDDTKTMHVEQADALVSPPSASPAVIPKPPTGLTRTTSALMMPPPPPRPPRGNNNNNNNNNNNSNNSNHVSEHLIQQLSTSVPSSPTSLLSMQNGGTASYEAPPPRNVLMQQRIEVVAASVAAPPYLVKETTDASALGKSYDSSKSYFPASLVDRHTAAECEELAGTKRPRSDSFHTTSFSELSLRDADSTTREESSMSSSSTDLANHEQKKQQNMVCDMPRRSASCCTLSSLVSSGGCATIEEEEADEPRGNDDGDSGVFEMSGDS